MHPKPRHEQIEDFCNAIRGLDPLGFRVVGEWLFERGGIVYDDHTVRSRFNENRQNCI